MFTAMLVHAWLRYHQQPHLVAMAIGSPDPATLRKEKTASILVMFFLIAAGVAADYFFFVVGAYATMSQVLCGWGLAFLPTKYIETAIFGGLTGHLNYPRAEDGKINPEWFWGGIKLGGTFVLAVWFGAWKLWQFYDRD